MPDDEAERQRGEHEPAAERPQQVGARAVVLAAVGRDRLQRRVERHAAGLELRERRHAAGHDEHVVTRQLQRDAAAFTAAARDLDVVGMDRRHLALEHHVEAGARRALLEALAVLAAQAEERVLAIDDGDVVARLLGERERRLDGAVAAADDDAAAALVGRGVEQRIADVGQVLTRHVQAPRRAATTDREHDVARAQRRAVGVHDERTVGGALDAVEGDAAGERQLVPGRQRLPQLDQLFLDELALLDAAVQRQLDRVGEHQLLARVLRDRAADRVLLVDHREVEAALATTERARQPAGAGADDDDVEQLATARRGPRPSARRPGVLRGP